MKITLEEDNGFLNNGKPTLVVLVIDGKHRIPYEATKTIQELYLDVAKFSNLNVIHPEKTFDDEWEQKKENIIEDKIVSIINEIQREDIVKCVKIHPRDEGADNDLEVGHEYRVLSVKKEKGQVITYDIVDDKAGTKYRITVLPDEIELLRKRKIKTNPVKKNYFQEMVNCEQCGAPNALELKDNKYVGECVGCSARLERERPKVVKSAT